MWHSIPNVVLCKLADGSRLEYRQSADIVEKLGKVMPVKIDAKHVSLRSLRSLGGHIFTGRSPNLLFPLLLSS